MTSDLFIPCRVCSSFLKERVAAVCFIWSWSYDTDPAIGYIKPVCEVHKGECRDTVVGLDAGLPEYLRITVPMEVLSS